MAEINDLDVRIIAEADDDGDEIARLTRQVRGELLELDVEDVKAVYTEAPEGTKAGFAEVLGLLTVTLTPEVLQAVVTTLGNVAVRTGRTIKMQLGGDSLEIIGASRAQTQQAMDAFLARHPVPDAPHAG